MMLFVMVDAHRPWRRVMLSEQRTGLEFALGMRALVDREYPHAPRIRVVLDNLSTHTPAALYQAFPAAEARRILRRLEFHSTPKHASWLNMVELRSASSKASAWTGASAIRKCSRPRSPPGRARVTARARASAGCSRPKKPGPRWAVLIPSQPLPMDRSNRQNLCEKVLVLQLGFIFRFPYCKDRKLLVEDPGVPSEVDGTRWISEVEKLWLR